MTNVETLNKRKAELIAQSEALLALATKETRGLTNKEREDADKLMGDIKSLGDLITRTVELQQMEMSVGKSDNKPTNETGFRNFGEFIQAAIANPRDSRLTRAQTTGAAADGGVLVPPQYLDELLAVKPADGIFRPRARVIPADSAQPDASISMPAIDHSGSYGVYGGVTVSWISEGGTKPETGMKFKEITLNPSEVAAYIPVTDRLLRNAPKVSATLTGMLRSAIIGSEDYAFLRGNGVGKPTGIIGHASTKTITRTTSSDVVFADIRNMFAACLFGGRYLWIASQTILPKLMTMKDEANNLIWLPNAVDGLPGSLLGIPVFINPRSPVLGSAGDLVLVDLEYYLIKDGFGIAVEASNAPLFTSNKTVIKAYRTVDGQPWLTAPVQLEDGTTTVSPFVVLQ